MSNNSIGLICLQSTVIRDEVKFTEAKTTKNKDEIKEVIQLLISHELISIAINDEEIHQLDAIKYIINILEGRSENIFDFDNLSVFEKVVLSKIEKLLLEKVINKI